MLRKVYVGASKVYVTDEGDEYAIEAHVDDGYPHILPLFVKLVREQSRFRMARLIVAVMGFIGAIGIILGHSPVTLGGVVLSLVILTVLQYLDTVRIKREYEASINAIKRLKPEPPRRACSGPRKTPV